jgi:hypothetical protein
MSAAMALPAKSFSAPRRLSDPLATARQIVEGAVCSFFAHLLPPFPEGRDTRGLAPPSCTTKISMRGYKGWRNFRENPKGEVRRMPPYSLENPLGERSRWVMTKLLLRTTFGVSTF